ncbi:hypothetical protein BDW62DRAFT_188731 [Aspergillus aurantiobrunneus]
MTRCLCPAQLLCLHRRSSLRSPFVVVPSPAPAAAPRPGWRLQWSNQYSVGVKRPVFDSEFLKKIYRLNRPKRPVPEWQGKKVKRWISLLEQFLSQSLNDDGTTHGTTHSTRKESSAVTRESFTAAIDLAHHLSIARTELNRDLLAHLGFKLNDWSTAYTVLSRLLDAAEALREASPARRGVIEELASSSQLSLDQLTDQDAFLPSQIPRNSRLTNLTSLNATTYRPFARDYYMLLMAEVWKSLGMTILYAVDTSPAKSKLAMSVVYRVLARLHHSGLVSERVYKYTTPDTYQATLRPPGMHLLSSHIMDVLSDAAWSVHQAEVAAKAATAGKDAPFLPAKIGIKELGHEIWLEFILWCCVEHGHINEGIWLASILTGRKGWKFQSWAPLLRDEQSLRNTKIDREVSTWPSPDPTNIKPQQQKRTDPPLPFHGLGKQTISVEVVAALLANLPNFIHLGLGAGGVSANELLRHANSLKFAIAPLTTSDSKFLPTTRATNWFTTRVIEAGGLTPEADPQLFDDFLKLTPHVVPPWSNDMCPVEEKSLAELNPSQLYDDTSAFTGLMEYNLKYHSSQRFCGSAMNLFAMWQEVMDTCKMRRVDEFFSSQMVEASANPPSQELDNFASLPTRESSNSQLSNVTIAHLFDLITASRAFAFGEWLLLSDDIDGPTVPASAYGDQALAPSLLRFAAATKNDFVGESVIRSLIPPITLNTLRAVLNYRIVMHQWDQVIPLLRYIRDNRIKSWSHSNIAAIAAEIIRFDYSLLQLQSSDPTNATIPDIETNLAEAKKVLYRILFGEFDEIPWRKRGNPRFQTHTLISFTRLFRHLASPSLHEITDSVFETEYVAMYRLPYIPSSPFHQILAAVAETEGTLAAKNVYKRFCVSYNSPEFNRLVEGGITRFYLKAERDFRRGDPNFDAEYFHHLQKRMVFPNPNTVRILTQAAVREYQAAVADMETPEAGSESGSPKSDPDHTAASQPHNQPPVPSVSDIETHTLPTQTPSKPSSLPAERKAEAEKTLIFCIKRFEVFRMSDAEIAREVGEEFYSNYQKSNADRREWDRRTKSELKRQWQMRENLKQKLEENGERTDDIMVDDVSAGTRKQRRRMWQKRQKLKERLKKREQARKDVKANVLLNMAQRKRDLEPRTNAEMRRLRRTRGRERAAATAAAKTGDGGQERRTTSDARPERLNDPNGIFSPEYH